MIAVLLAAAIVTIAAVLPPAARAVDGIDPCVVPLVARSESGVEVHLVEIATGGGRSFRTGPGSPWVTGIFPLSPGLAADLVRGDNEATLIVNCTPDEVQPSVRATDGSSRDLPAVPRENYDALSVRVNIVTGDGHRAAFRIVDRTVRRDTSAPAVNIFDGRVPMSAGDVAVTLEVTTPSPAPALSGIAELTYRDGFILVPVTIGDGPAHDFILDMAATGSVVGVDFVPEGVEPVPMVAMEHSPEGAREIRQGPEGAGGEVTATLGVVRVGPLSIGDAILAEAEFHVMPRLPEIGRPIAGVLGLNVLRQAGRIAFGYTSRASGRRNDHDLPEIERAPEEPWASKLLLGSEVGNPEPDHVVVVVPLRSVARLLFVPAEIAGQEVDLILDTGARLTLLPPALADRLGIAVTNRNAAVLRGLDGHPISVDLATIDELRIGGAPFRSEPIGIADLPVFAAIGLPKDTGVLGATFWSRFERIVVDFEASRLELISREES